MLQQINDAHADVACPYCQVIVLDWIKEQYIQPCQHTQFIALDFGFEYILDDFEALLPNSVDTIHQQELNIWDNLKDALTDLKVYKMPLGVLDYNRYIGFKEVE